MITFLLAYLGGVPRIVSPCILAAPTLIGLPATFAAVSTVAAVAGGWAVEAHQYGGLIAVALPAVFGLALLRPALSDSLPFVAFGGRLPQAAEREGARRGAHMWPSIRPGVALGPPTTRGAFQ